MKANGMKFEAFQVGDVISFVRNFTLEDSKSFSALSGDTNQLHRSDEFAVKAGQSQAIAPLMLAASPLSAMVGNGFGQHRALILSVRLQALQPTPYHLDITYSAKIVAMHEGTKALSLQVISFHHEQMFLKAEMLVRIDDDIPAIAAMPDAFEIERVNEHKTALITGASGAIGRHTARLMARRGWDLVLHCNTSRSETDALAEECAKFGGGVTVFQASLEDEQQTAELVLSLNSENMPVAFLHLASPPLDAPLTDQLNVNYRAGRQIMQGLLAEMLRRQQGTMLVLGSSATHYSMPGWEDYIAAKNAAVGFTNSIEKRFAGYGLRGKVVAPGYVDTAFSESVRPSDVPLLMAEEVADAIVDHLQDQYPDDAPYLWLEPSSRHYGGFGFFGFDQRAEGQAQPAVAANIQASQLRLVTPVIPSNGHTAVDVEGLVRGFFKLSPQHPIAGEGLGATTGWDSLGHIELMVFLESQLGIAFTSQEMADATQMQTLMSVVERKLG